MLASPRESRRSTQEPGDAHRSKAGPLHPLRDLRRSGKGAGPIPAASVGGRRVATRAADLRQDLRGNRRRNRPRSGCRAGMLISRITSRAPGLSTRAISGRPASRSVRLRSPNPTIAPSKLASANGSSSASALPGGARPPCCGPAGASPGRNRPRSPARRSPAAIESWRAEIEGPGAEIEVDPPGCPFPAEPGIRLPTPPPVEVQADDLVEEVVAGRDGGEHPPDVGPLLRAALDAVTCSPWLT